MVAGACTGMQELVFALGCRSWCWDARSGAHAGMCGAGAGIPEPEVRRWSRSAPCGGVVRRVVKHYLCKAYCSSGDTA